jgi:hypothetical protein
MKRRLIPALLAMALAPAAVHAQGTGENNAQTSRIVVAGPSTVPSAIVIVERETTPRPATAPTVDTRGPVAPKIDPPA